MKFRFFSNMVSQASRQVAAGVFIAGILLTGFGFLIYLLPKLFATLAALLFFFSGAGCIVMGVKIFWAQHKFDKLSVDDSERYRENVRIHIDEHYEQ